MATLPNTEDDLPFTPTEVTQSILSMNGKTAPERGVRGGYDLCGLLTEARSPPRTALGGEFDWGGTSVKR